MPAKKPTKKKAAKKKTPTGAKNKIGGRTNKNPLTKIDKVTIGQIDGCARQVYTKIIKLSKPELKFPVRSLSNVIVLGRPAPGGGPLPAERPSQARAPAG